jgi:hypothetical protein
LLETKLAVAQTSYGGGTVRQQGQVQAQGSQEVRGSSGGSFLYVVPTFSVYERYDSNIYRQGGRQISDFVTDIRPGARANYSGDLIDGTLTGSVLSGIYARNPGLNYVGVSAMFDAELDKITRRMARGLGVSVRDSVTYYPEQPAFATAESPESDFTRGIQAQRSNSLSNTSMVQGTYAMTPLTQLNASYSFQSRRFLGKPYSSDPSIPPIALFNTTVQAISAGPVYQVLPNHSIGASYAYREIAFEPSTGSGPGRSSVIHGGMITWRSGLTRELTAEISPGVSVSTSTPDNLIWTMRASVQWVDQNKSATVSYSRGLYPSFYAQAGLLLSNVVSGTFTLSFASGWSATLGANYGQNTQTGQTSLRFESVVATGSLRYTFYPGLVATITGSQGNFTLEQTSSTLKYDRQVGMIGLTAEWN